MLFIPEKVTYAKCQYFLSYLNTYACCQPHIIYFDSRLTTIRLILVCLLICCNFVEVRLRVTKKYILCYLMKVSGVCTNNPRRRIITNVYAKYEHRFNSVL